MYRQPRFLIPQRFAPPKILFTNPKPIATYTLTAPSPSATPVPIAGIIAGSVIGGIAVVCILAFGWYKFKTYQHIQPIRLDTLPRHIVKENTTLWV